MLVLALALLPVLLLPVFLSLGETARRALDVAGALIWAAFLVEYLTLLRLAPDRRRFVRSHVPDLLLLLVPFLRPLRALRALPVLAAAFGHGTASVARQGLSWTLAVVVVLLGSLSVVVLDVERGHPDANIRTLSDALWWSITTATTVGYGDRFPVTAGGRAVGVVVMLCGIALVGVVTATVAAWFVRADTERETADELAALRAEIAALRESLSGPSARADAPRGARQPDAPGV
jgi:voltage-gated potassium channel